MMSPRGWNLLMVKRQDARIMKITLVGGIQRRVAPLLVHLAGIDGMASPVPAPSCCLGNGGDLAMGGFLRPVAAAARWRRGVGAAHD